jgi:predicted ATPase
VHYTKFRFKNFKGITDMTLDLSGDVTTLIGLNESGKTTILEAIFCFSYGAEDLEVINPGMASLRIPEQWIPISKRANFNGEVVIEAHVHLEPEDKLALRTTMRNTFGLRLADVPSDITIAERHIFRNSRFEETKRQWSLSISGTRGRERKPRVYGAKTDEWQGAVAALKTTLPRIWYFPNFLFELPERFSLDQSEQRGADEDDDKSRFYRATFENILGQLGYGANLETHIVKRVHSAERADQRSLGSLLLDMGRVMTTTIFDGWDRIFSRAPMAQEVELAATADGESASLELRIKGPDGYYDLSERSLGFRWFFMFLLMTSFHGFENEGPQPLFLLDEPASNLHSSAQAELLKSFATLTSKCRLVYTTHSHHLIDVRWLDSSYVVKNAALGSLDFADYVASRVGSNTSVSATKYRKFVSTHPDQTSYFQPVLDLLEYRPSVLEPVPSVVLVEGKSDFFLARYALDVLGVAGHFRLVPGGGAGALDPLIRLHVGWGKSFLVLLDGDDEGVRQRARYEEEFGPMITDRCVLLPDVCGDPSAVAVERLVSAEDQRAIVSAVFGDIAVKKKVLHQSVKELYARDTAVKLSEPTLTRFRTLFERLDELLAKQEGLEQE